MIPSIFSILRLMIFEEITSPEAKRFLQENMDKPVEELLLRAQKFPGLNVPLLVAQMEGRHKAKKKLPSWYQSDNIVYPVKLSMEQCSSELTAQYKASLLTGEVVLDLTGGFGVDSTLFATKMKRVLYIERNKDLAEIAAHNFKVLGKDNIEVFPVQTENFIATYKESCDWIFIDPARRKAGSKVFRLADCEPDVVSLRESLLDIGHHIMIKTSPLLDLDIALKELQHVKEVHVVAVENECKELLFILDKEIQDPKIIAVNLRKEGHLDSFRFFKNKESEAPVEFHLPMHYLYEPNAAILKAGAFRSLAHTTGLFKLHTNSHLYTSDQYKENFPGRSFQLIKTLKYSKKEILAELPEGKANISVRNFPDSVELIRKKTGLKDGGTHYLFATRDLHDKPVILLTKKIT